MGKIKQNITELLTMEMSSISDMSLTDMTSLKSQVLSVNSTKKKKKKKRLICEFNLQVQG